MIFVRKVVFTALSAWDREVVFKVEFQGKSLQVLNPSVIEVTR